MNPELQPGDVYPAATRLTDAQARYLRQIIDNPARVYNDRARRPLEALEAFGLVEVAWDMRPQAKGNGIELVGCSTAAATDAGLAWMEARS